MSETESAGEQPAEAFPLTLDEACQRISATDPRVELIAAFHSEEKTAGRSTGLEQEYRDRLAAFAARPA